MLDEEDEKAMNPKLALLESALEAQAVKRGRTPRYGSVVDAVSAGVDPVRVQVGDGYQYIPSERAEEIYQHFSNPRKPFVDNNSNFLTTITRGEAAIPAELQERLPSEVMFETKVYRAGSPENEMWSFRSPAELNQVKPEGEPEWVSDVRPTDVVRLLKDYKSYFNSPQGQALYHNVPLGGLGADRARTYRKVLGFQDVPAAKEQILDTRRRLSGNRALDSIYRHGDQSLDPDVYKALYP